MKTIWKRRMLALTVPLALLAGHAQAGDKMMDSDTMMDEGMASHDTMMDGDHGKMADQPMMTDGMAEEMDHGMNSDTMGGGMMNGEMMDKSMMTGEGMAESDTMN